jgi:hypothetical protein
VTTRIAFANHKEAYMSELSHFEAQSAKTPTKQPWAIIGGTVLLIILLILVNQLAPNEAIKESKAKQEQAAVQMPAAGSMNDDDDI